MDWMDVEAVGSNNAGVMEIDAVVRTNSGQHLIRGGGVCFGIHGDWLNWRGFYQGEPGYQCFDQSIDLGGSQRVVQVQQWSAVNFWYETVSAEGEKKQDWVECFKGAIG
uniref:Uncharacterized protein n=1 Tax=Romanomermis culicivorax TaxID=13658 RepID=A0A915J6I6_ROMCU